MAVHGSSWLHATCRNRPYTWLSATLLCAISVATTACSESDVSSPAQQATRSVLQQQSPPKREAVTYAQVPAGQVPMTNAELRSTIVGRRYVDIQHRSAIVTEAFEPDGTYRYESDYHNFGGAYWIAEGWLCRRWDQPEHQLTTCSEVYVLPTGDISYVAPASGRFQHYKIVP